MDIKQFHELCDKRRSIRYFSDEPVSKDDIMELLRCAQLAPSVENLQPWMFHVVLNQDMKEKLREASCYGDFVDGASVFMVITSDRSKEGDSPEPLWNPKELEYSCMAAAENVLLGAAAMNLGACWVSLHHGTAHEVLELPMHEVVIGGIMIGHYKKGEEDGNDGHTRKPLEDSYTLHE